MNLKHHESYKVYMDVSSPFKFNCVSLNAEVEVRFNQNCTFIKQVKQLKKKQDCV